MKVEILYFPGCPNHPSAVGLVREALAQEGVAAEVVEVEIEDLAKGAPHEIPRVAEYSH